jgi:hypothetical protein
MTKQSEKKFSLYQGTVFSIRRWSDTHVWSSGGGGYVDPKIGGRVESAQISSEVVQKAEVFIKDDQGVQHALELTDVGVPLTEGNKVIAVMDDRWEGKPLPLYFENVDTRMFEAPIISTGKPLGHFLNGFGKGFLWASVFLLSNILLSNLTREHEKFFVSTGWFFCWFVGLPVWWMANKSIASKKKKEFQHTNAAFLSEVQDVAKKNGINFGLKDPVFGPLVRSI